MQTPRSCCCCCWFMDHKLNSKTLLPQANSRLTVTRRKAMQDVLNQNPSGWSKSQGTVTLLIAMDQLRQRKDCSTPFCLLEFRANCQVAISGIIDRWRAACSHMNFPIRCPLLTHRSGHFFLADPQNRPAPLLSCKLIPAPGNLSLLLPLL